jgi:hypothetical protein
MLPFGVTIPATVPQGSEIPEGLMNTAVFISILYMIEQTCAHHRDSQLYQYNIWYMSLCVGDRPVCRSGIPNLHTGWPPTQSDIYQMLY